MHETKSTTEEQEDIYSAAGGDLPESGAAASGISFNVADAKWPQYASRIERSDTFKTWPKPKIDVNEFAEAGMFYKGDEDRTECYFCGIPLKLWEIHDDPWIEHARFSPDCQFLHFHKGWAFVKASLEFYDLSTTGIQLKRAANSVGYGTMESSNQMTSQPSSSTSQTPTTVTAPKPRPVKRVEPREIRSRLDLDSVKKIVALGYPRELVGQVIGEQLQTEGDDFKNHGEFVRAVMNAAEMLGIPLHTPALLTTQNFSYPASSKTSASTTGPSTSTSLPPLASASLAGSAPPGPNSVSGNEDLDPAVKKAMEENKSLKQKLYCKKCWKREVNVVLLNCGHMVLCEECAKLVHICPLPGCHRHIVQRVKVFVA